MRAAPLGVSGSAGGELTRLLPEHPHVGSAQATSDRVAGRPVHAARPSLRGRTGLTFAPYSGEERCDVLILGPDPI